MAAPVDTESDDPDPVPDRTLFDEWLVEFHRAHVAAYRARRAAGT